MSQNLSSAAVMIGALRVNVIRLVESDILASVLLYLLNSLQNAKKNAWQSLTFYLFPQLV